MTNNLTPFMDLNFDAWISEAKARTVEYEGEPESAVFLVEARRYLACRDRIAALEQRIQVLEERCGSMVYEMARSD